MASFLCFRSPQKFADLVVNMPMCYVWEMHSYPREKMIKTLTKEKKRNPTYLDFLLHSSFIEEEGERKKKKSNQEAQVRREREEKESDFFFFSCKTIYLHF